MSAETALITGASSGIGCELARLFAADKSNLVLVARTQEKLDQLAAELRRDQGVAVHVLAKDLADPQSPQAIFDALAAQGVTVDVLVNNAGFGAAGPVASLPLEKQLHMIQVNVTALTHLTRLFLPGMAERRSGGILNVSSTAGFQPGPYMAVYYATKAYVLSFTEALAEELIRAASGPPVLPPAHGDEICRRRGHGKQPALPAGDGGCQERRPGRLPRFSAWADVGHPGAEEQTGSAGGSLRARVVVRKLVKRLQV